jgi:uncharacterized protein YbjQ (UPF0145 family)
MGIVSGMTFVSIHGSEYCPPCAVAYVDSVTRDVILTTTDHVDGFRVQQYLGLDSVEVVMSTGGAFSEFGGEIAEVFGARPNSFDTRLQNAKRAATRKLQLYAAERGGNAVIGVTMTCTEFSGNRIGVIMNGTIVSVVPVGKPEAAKLPAAPESDAERLLSEAGAETVYELLGI